MMPDLVGQKIESYDVQEKLGQGGMAAVYLARDERLQRDVVLKVLLPNLAGDEELRRRFDREARATAQLSHPNIVPIYATNHLPDGVPYIVMEYISGGSLSDHLKTLAAEGQWISTVYGLAIVRQMADALTVAHEAHIIHRDLKPGNILLRKDGAPVLSDLGIASVRMETTRLTRTGEIIGTPEYMSPEQAMSQATVDGRSDIYSLGIILYELLSAQLPFHADSPFGVLHQHIYEEPTPLPHIRPNLTPQTYDLVATCMQKQANDRFQSAAELVAALDDAIGAEDKNPQISVGDWRPPPIQEIFNRVSRQRPLTTKSETGTRRRLYWLIPLAVVLLMLAITAWAWFSRTDTVSDANTPAATRVEPTATETPVVLAFSGSVPTSTFRPTSSPSPLPTETAVATNAPTPTGTAVPSPTAAEEISLPPAFGTDDLIAYSCDLDGQSQIYLFDPDTDEEFLLPGQPPNSMVPAFSPDGRELAFRSDASGSWQVYAIDLDGSNLRQITSGPGQNFEAVWSPDGRQLAFVSDRDGQKQLYLMNSDGTGQQPLTQTGASVRNDDPTWSVNNLIAYESNPEGRHQIFLITPTGGGPTILISSGEQTTTPAWAADGTQIAFEVGVDDNWQIWTATAEGTSLRQVTTAGSRNLRPAWSPDSTAVAFHSNYQQEEDLAFDIWIIDLATGDLRRVTERGACYNPAWSWPPAEACALEIGAQLAATENTRLWDNPDVLAGVALVDVPPGESLQILDGPVWGPVQRATAVSDWWWQVQTESGQIGWVWQGRMEACNP